MVIDRSQFYPIGSPEILQLFDGVERLINPLDMDRSATDTSLLNGVAAISMLKFKMTDGDSSFNEADNLHVLPKPNTNLKPNDDDTVAASIPVFFINATFFLTGTSFEREKKQLMHYDLRAGANKMAKHYSVDSSNYVGTTNTWTNIPAYPTTPQQQQLSQKFGQERAGQLISQMYYKTNQRGTPSWKVRNK